MLETLSNVLIEAINDEYNARATYLYVIRKFVETDGDAQSIHFV